ncbi:hypothetical protein M430DRAFT_94601 [Amorphotheca resinae ATCC 22711]|uniref:Chromatin modification-related protein n=1 Tax=Amorphotheca resinae ATCC 22711 TaxID=857342 RepID=A0A2T3B9Q3_AMORE|nr:hypothetical protein M430DRAFT_94601 [Amorphotheca resinae ATCC 22711]PSS25018.1 hypothetical protein M430DRAFT_94601 [Amorphotheca resinae ATCC 22711]
MKTAKPPPADITSGRRAQPLRQTRNNPPRSSIGSARPFGARGSLGALDGPPSPEPIEIFPAITHFADVITALPKELVRHFTLLKEVDAKIFAPEEELGRLVDAALKAPLPERRQTADMPHPLGPTSTPMSTQGSLNGSIVNGHGMYASYGPDAVDNSAVTPWDPANVPRRKLFQHCAYTMQNMLVSLDEKNHVISTAAEALNRQLARIDDCFPYVELEVSEEARYGSVTHWAYPENRVGKSAGGSRRDPASGNNASAAAQHLVEEAAARSDARKQALLAKKGNKNHAELDFDSHHDARHKDSSKKAHGNSKVRKAADASPVGLGITNGTGPNGNPPKRRKVGSERALNGVFGNNSTATKKAASPAETPPGDGPKKRQRGAATTTTNGHSRKRNNTVSTIAMSPSIASSPVRSTFPETKTPGRTSPPPTNGTRPAASRGRQNSTASGAEKRPSPSEPSKQSGSAVGTPDLEAAASVTGRSIPEVKTSMKETGANSKGEHLLEDADKEEPEMVGGISVGERRNSTMKREESEVNGDAMQGIQATTITTKSGRASKPSTPAIPQFPDPIRSRPSRNALETASNNKRSHKKGAGAAAQQLMAQQHQVPEADEGSSMQGDDDDVEIDADEPTYCYCNGVSYGEMVGCDADGCEREWFHLECVGLKVAPRGNAKWYCDDCKEKLKTKRFNGR